MKDMITFLLDFGVKLFDSIFLMCGVFGIAIDLTPWIKFNPIRWTFSKIGKLLNGDRFDELKKDISQLQNEVKQNRLDQDKTRMKDIRSRILDFSNSLGKRERDIEEFEEIFELDDEYISLLNRCGMKNGRTDRAMENTKRYYKNMTEIRG